MQMKAKVNGKTKPGFWQPPFYPLPLNLALVKEHGKSIINEFQSEQGKGDMNGNQSTFFPCEPLSSFWGLLYFTHTENVNEHALSLSDMLLGN